MSYSRLFSPLDLGPVVARNRIVCGAHFTMYTEPSRTYGEPGFYGERYGRYLAEYAFAYVSMYAGLASAMIALVFLYYSAWIFVYGGELNAAIARVREAKA